MASLANDLARRKEFRNACLAVFGKMRDWILYYHDQLRIAQTAASLLRHSSGREPHFASDKSFWSCASCTAGKSFGQRPPEHEQERISFHPSPGWSGFLFRYLRTGNPPGLMDYSTEELSG